MSKGMLIDLTKCIGCRACQVACKQWNNLPALSTGFSPEFTNPHARSAYTWTIVEFLTTEVEGETVTTFAKTQCMHCVQPACVKVCSGAALKKTAAGPVTVERDRCVACWACADACPFGIPAFELDKAVPKMQKCSMCAGRIAAGMEPACAATCPGEAIVFGERSELLRVAHGRITQAPAKYVNHVYGETEVGGTSVLYLTGVPLDLAKLREGVFQQVPPKVGPLRSAHARPAPVALAAERIKKGIALSVDAPRGVLKPLTGSVPPTELVQTCFVDLNHRLIMVKPFHNDESAVTDAHDLLKWADAYRSEYPEAVVVMLLRPGDSPGWLERAWQGSAALKIVRL